MENNAKFIEDSLNMEKQFGGEVASNIIQPHLVWNLELRMFQMLVSLNMVRQFGGGVASKVNQPQYTKKDSFVRG